MRERLKGESITEYLADVARSLVPLGKRTREQQKQWAACPHGVLGGNLCEKCVQQQNEIADRIRRHGELEESQRRLAAAADILKSSERVRLVKSLTWTIEELRSLTWQEFETEIAQMFERLGYSVEQTPLVNDHGRDAILRKAGNKYLVQCKKYAERNVSGRPDLQGFYGAIIADGAASGYFVTTGRFSKEAREFAAAVHGRIELVDPDTLRRMMFDSTPHAADNDSYHSMCRECGDVVFHRLRMPRSVNCGNGHEVRPTLNVKSILGGG
jgi:hypothetical protein